MIQSDIRTYVLFDLTISRKLTENYSFYWCSYLIVQVWYRYVRTMCRLRNFGNTSIDDIIPTKLLVPVINVSVPHGTGTIIVKIINLFFFFYKRRKSNILILIYIRLLSSTILRMVLNLRTQIGPFWNIRNFGLFWDFTNSRHFKFPFESICTWFYPLKTYIQ